MSENDQERGLYNKYNVQRRKDPQGKHKHCSYFVLDLHHDKFAAEALKAYAEACRYEYPLLAAALIAWAKRPIT